MTRPRLLDLFCGAGGAAVGYHRAGFDVTGVDLLDQPRYPFQFIRADALDFPLDGHDVIHASPPCQLYSALASIRPKAGHPDLVAPIRVRLKGAGVPWIIENVHGAPLDRPALVCGTAFALGVPCRDGIYRQIWRHRYFESSLFLFGTTCRHVGQPIGVYGNGGGQPRGVRADGTWKRSYMGTQAERREAMGIDWMRRSELSQAIPPTYTEYVGRQLIDALTRVRRPSPALA
jgi:DNA (cytosine-5)-methyltransferase 1